MKKLIIILALLSILTSGKSFCQDAPVTIRGHFNDDLYVRGGSGVENLLLYFTGSGDTIHLQSSTIYFAINLTSESVPGKIYGHNFHEFGESIDYGKTFHLKAPFVNDYTSIEGIYGGEIPGEFIIQGFDHITNHYVIYKTTDYFSNYTLVDSNAYLEHENAEIGHVSGEIYKLPVRSNGSWLLHSLNYGADFDSILIDNSIIDVNQGRYFQTLSRGSVQGELFLVTHMQNVSLTENYFSIYHTIDFGASWELKSTQTFNSARQGFTAGRGLCKFYIANLNPTPGSQYNTLQIYSSSDCGVTFTLKEYQLTPDVGLPETLSKSQVLISPNPSTNKISIECKNTVGEISIEILDGEGRQVMGKNYPNQEIIDIDISSLKAGIYLLKMHSKNRVEASKLVIH